MRSIKTSKRVITVILSLVMLFTLIPTEVVATTLEKPGTAGSTAQGNVKPEIPFTDVGEGSWYYDAVQYAYINGFFGGIDASTFKPDGTMTRGMFVTVLGRMAGVDQAAYTGLYFFEDVAEDAWYAPYVAWASRHGIADGVGNNKFNPNGLITREQMAVLIINYFEKFDVVYDTGANITSILTDIDIVSYWARDAVSKLWKVGLLGGNGTSFNPKGNASRAQAATLCMRTDEAVETWYKEPLVPSDRVSVNLDAEKIPVPTPSPTDGGGREVDRDDDGGDNDGGDNDGGDNDGGDNDGEDNDEEAIAPEIGIYSITDVGASAGTHEVNAEVSTMEDCFLEIVVYEDDKESAIVLDSKMVSVEGDSDLANIEVSMTNELPRYFGIVASLVDSSGNQLCDPYALIEFTRMYEKFESKTEEDFPAGQVIGLDDNTEENFAVVKEDVRKIITEDSGTNDLISAYENTYYFGNADTNLTGLNTGDKITVVSEDGSDFYIIEIASISIGSDGTVTIVSTDELTLEEFFDHINISVMEYVDDPEEMGRMSISTAGEDYAPLGVMRSSALSKDYTYEKEFNKVYGSGGSNLELDALVGLRVYITADIDYSVDWKWGFIPVGFEIYAKVGVGVESEIDAVSVATSMPGKDNKPVEISIYSGSFKIGYGFTGNLDARLVIDWAAYAEGEMNIKASAECGIIYNDGSISTYKKINDPNLEPKFAGKMMLSIGPKLSATIEWAGGIVDATLWILPKVVLNSNAYYAPASLPTNVAFRHECDGCINGTVDFVIDAGFEAIYDLEIWNGTLFEKTYPAIYKKRLYAFYYSIANKPTSIHGGATVFATGTCPNVTYRTSFDPRNNLGVTMPDAAVKVYKGYGPTARIVATGKGAFSTYLLSGTYTITASSKSEQFSQSTIMIASSALPTIVIDSGTVHETGISLDKTSISLPLGSTEMLSAIYQPANTTFKTPQWSSSNRLVATVDDNGKVTAVGAGTATITVRTYQGIFSATARVTVTIPVTGVSLDKQSLSMNTGNTSALTTTISPYNATNKSVTWSSSNRFVATVSDTGIVTALSAGKAEITAKTEDGTFIASCVAIVKEKEKQSDLSINDPGAKTYGDADFALSTTGGNGTGAVTYDITEGSDVIRITGDMVTILKDGTATVTATKSGDEDHRPQSSEPMTITVGKRNLSDVTVNLNGPLVYNGYAQEPVPIISDNGATLSISNDFILSYSSNKNAGEATMKIEAVPGGSCYGEQTVKFTIAKAELTVTADSLWVVPGSPLPTYTYWFYGFAPDEDESAISGEPTLTCDYSQGYEDHVYTISISQGSLSAENYTFIFDDGNLTVGDGAADSYFEKFVVSVSGDSERVHLLNGYYTLDASYGYESKSISVGAGYLSTTITDEELMALGGKDTLTLTFNDDNSGCTITIDLELDTAFSYSESNIWTLTSALSKIMFTINEMEPPVETINMNNIA